MFLLILLYFLLYVSVQASFCLEVVYLPVRVEYIRPLAECQSLCLLLSKCQLRPANKENPVKIYIDVFFFRLAAFLRFFFEMRHLPKASCMTFDS